MNAHTRGPGARARPVKTPSGAVHLIGSRTAPSPEPVGTVADANRRAVARARLRASGGELQPRTASGPAAAADAKRGFAWGFAAGAGWIALVWLLVERVA